MLIPLITLPYLIKTLGKEMYGLVIYAQAIASYFEIFINFGFNISATKDISNNRNNNFKISEIVSSIYIIKGFLFFISFIILSIILSVLPQTKGHELLFYLSMYVCLNDWLFPQWYFLGKEKMKYITIVNLVAKSVFLILIFVLINNKEDYFKVPLIHGIGVIIAGIITLYLIFIKENVKFKWLNFSIMWSYMRESFPFFVSRIAAIINSRTNTVIIGSFLGLSEVAYYDVANKIAELGKIPIELLNQVIFPNAVKNKNMKFIKKIIYGSLGIGLSIYIGILLFNDFILQFLGGSEFLNAKPIVLILSISIPIVSISYHLGNCVLIPMEENKAFNRSVIASTVVYLLIIGSLYILGLISAYSLALTIVSTELFVLLFRFYYSKKHLYSKSYENIK